MHTVQDNATTSREDSKHCVHAILPVLAISSHIKPSSVIFAMFRFVLLPADTSREAVVQEASKDGGLAQDALRLHAEAVCNPIVYPSR